MMEKVFLLAVVAICCTPTVLSRCRNESVVFTSNSLRGKTDFYFITGSAVTITLEYKCYSSDRMRFDYFWLKTGQNTTNGRRLWRVDINPFDKYNRVDYGNDITLQYESQSNGFQLSTTILNVNSTYDKSEFLLHDRTPNYESFKIHLNIVCCRATSIPSHLSLNNAWIGEDLNCLASGTAKCKSGAMFVKGRANDYRTGVNLQCNANGNWNVQSVSCLPSCPRPSYPHLYIYTYPRNSKRYKLNFKMSLRCQVGKMHAAISPTHLFKDSKITCQANETWTSTDVACWTGQVVDFSRKIIILRSGPTIFTCSARSVLDPRIVVGDHVIEGNGKAWANITMTPDYNGITAACRELDSFNMSQYETNTYLNVQFEPELTATVPARFEFESGSRNHVAILFRANPTVSLSNIQAMRNGSSITNFYITVNGTNQEAVLHFTRVEFSDGGDYIISFSSPTLASILTVNFTIDVLSPRPDNALFGTPGNIAAVGLGGVLLLVVIGGIIAFSRLKSRNKPERKVNNDIAVVYNEQPNYEDVEDVPARKPQSKLKTDYVNTRMGRENENAYVAPMRPALTPSAPQRQAYPGNHRISAGSFDSFYEDTYVN